METQNKVVTGAIAVLVAAALGYALYDSPEPKYDEPMATPYKVPSQKPEAPIAVPDRTPPVLGQKDAKKEGKHEGDKTPYMVPGEVPVAFPQMKPVIPVATPNRVPEPMEKNEAVPKKDMKGDPIAVPADVKKGKTPNLTPTTIEQFDAKKVEEKGESIINEDIDAVERDLEKLRNDIK